MVLLSDPLDNDPYAIALNGFDVLFRWSDALAPNIVYAVLPIGQYVVDVVPKTREVVSQGFDRGEEITNANGSPVPKTIFEDDQHAGVSAILPRPIDEPEVDQASPALSIREIEL